MAKIATPKAPKEMRRPRKGCKRFLTKKMLLIAVPALVLLLGGGGAGAYFFLLKPSDTAKAKVAEAPPLTPPQVAFTDVPDILVNIQSDDGTPTYLKLSLSLELDSNLEKAGMQRPDAAAGRPVSVLSARTPDRRSQRLGRRAAAQGRTCCAGSMSPPPPTRCATCF